jgi:hypothetical protein
MMLSTAAKAAPNEGKNKLFRRTMIISAAAIAVLSLVGCSSDEPAPTVTVTAPAEETPEVSDRERMELVMQLVWSSTSEADKESMCTIYNLDSDLAWEAFNSGADDSVDEEVFNEFFSGVC